MLISLENYALEFLVRYQFAIDFGDYQTTLDCSSVLMPCSWALCDYLPYITLTWDILVLCALKERPLSFSSGFAPSLSFITNTNSPTLCF